MSAARKPHGAAKPDKTPATSKAKDKSKAKAGDVPPARRPLNPLPHDEVGPRLLVKLQAEKIMTKVHLKEAWEGPEGWRFDELCAVVACALGDGFPVPGEEALAEQVASRRKPALIKEIRKRASPPLTYVDTGTDDILPEAYDGLLILGLATPGFPFADPRLNDTAQLGHGLAAGLGLEYSKVNLRTFERAKNNVLKRYAEHLRRQEARRAKLGAGIAVKPVGIPRRTHTELLRKALARFAILPVSPGVVNAAFRKVALRPPGKWWVPPGGR